MEESIFPKPTSLVNAIKLSAALIAIGISVFHLYTGAFGIIEAYGMRTIHLMTLMTLTFLYWPASKKWSKEKSAIIDIPLALICLTIDIYLMVNHYRFTTREWYTGPMNIFDISFGWIPCFCCSRQPDAWRVEDRTIIGESTLQKPCEKTHYLYWTGGEPGDFIMRCEIKLLGGNSGIQFRSEKRPDFNTFGYQADFTGGKWETREG